MSMTLIQTQTLGSDNSTIQLTSIPQTFTDLLVLLSPRSSQASSSGETVNMTCNSDGIGSGLYTSRFVWRNLSSQFRSSFTSVATMQASAPAASATANSFGNISIYLPDYSGSNVKLGSVESVGGNNASATALTCTVLRYNSTAAISSITFTLSNGNFVTNSSVSIYGITKGSGGATV